MEGGEEEIRCNFARHLWNEEKEVVTGSRLYQVMCVYVCGNIRELMVHFYL